MTKENILRAFLEDELFIEKQYLKPEEASRYKWSNTSNNNLIEVLKIAIEGEQARESSNLTEKKINTFLNRQQ